MSDGAPEHSREPTPTFCRRTTRSVIPIRISSGRIPSGAYPAKPTAGNITSSTATITWYTYEQAVTTVVKVGTDPNNINIKTNCGPSVYTGTDNLWINTCHISGLSPSTLYYFGVGGTDVASNFAFSSVDPTNNLQGDTLNFTTTQ